MTDFHQPIGPVTGRVIALLGTAGFVVLPVLLALYGAVLAAA